jgi:hypothetical protein
MTNCPVCGEKVSGGSTSGPGKAVADPCGHEIDPAALTNMSYLEYDAEEGTEVEVQSTTQPDNFHTGYVDEEGRVRAEKNGALFVAENYAVIGEK